MKIIKTHDRKPEDLNPQISDWIYNAIDCAATRDVWDTTFPQLDVTTTRTYTFERELQGPVLEMRLRGVLVDQARKAEVIDELWELSDTLEANLNRIVFEGIGLPSFNWRSTKDLRALFYDTLGVPPPSSSRSVDREAREKIEVYPIATQLIKHINALTELGDKISVLRTGVDNDGRIRTSYNIAGTSTGRFSSSLSEFGTGGNLQNVEESLRSIFIADPGYKFAKFDAKSGESFCVGAIEWNLFRDPRYLDACESGSPHTAVARICWPSLPWTGDIERDTAIAKEPYYRHYSRYFMCKKIGHGSNYGGKPQTISEQTRIPIAQIAEFQPKYFRAFPAHQRWHEWVANELRRTGQLTTLTGRRRSFFGRRSDPKVYREALAFDPQGSLADIVNLAMLKLWRMGIATVMFQDHDAITFMYPEDHEDEVVPELMKHLIISIPLEGGRELRIPYDCEIGWNKGKYDAEKNPDGLKSWEGHDQRKRHPTISLMDSIVHRANRRDRFAPTVQKVDGDLDPSGGLAAEGVDTDL